MVEYTFDNYKFIIETENANNILLEKVGDGGNIIDAIKSFILFLHKNKVEYITIFDIKKRDRYIKVLRYIYNNANDDEKSLYNKSSFIYDGDKIRCKIY